MASSAMIAAPTGIAAFTSDIAGPVPVAPAAVGGEGEGKGSSQGGAAGGKGSSGGGMAGGVGGGRGAVAPRPSSSMV